MVVFQASVVVHAAYGSIKDFSVYSTAGIKPDQIFCVAKHYNRKYERQAQVLYVVSQAAQPYQNEKQRGKQRNEISCEL